MSAVAAWAQVSGMTGPSSPVSTPPSGIIPMSNFTPSSASSLPLVSSGASLALASLLDSASLELELEPSPVAELLSPTLLPLVALASTPSSSLPRPSSVHANANRKSDDQARAERDMRGSLSASRRRAVEPDRPEIACVGALDFFVVDDVFRRITSFVRY